jgi:hypothetical protein
LPGIVHDFRNGAPAFQLPAAMPRAELRAAMIAPPTAMARNDRAKPVPKNLRRSQARMTSSPATTAMAALIAAP